MATQYLNVVVGTALANGDIPVHGKGGGTSQTGHVSLAYDDTVVTKKNQLLAGLNALIQQVKAGATSLT